MINKDTDIELRVEKLAPEGRAVARHDGLVCFVRGGVPGDTVRAHLNKVRRNYAEAEVVELLAPSLQRVAPRCKHFGTCGGCAWQHASYELQLQEKQRFVVDAFERIAGMKNIPIAPIVGSDDIFYYRNKMEFSFSRQRWLTREEITRNEDLAKGFGLGLHVPGRFDKVVDIEECWLQSEQSNGVLASVREFSRSKQLSIYSTRSHEGYLRHLVIRQSTRTGDLMVNLVTSTDESDILHELTAVLLKACPRITTIVNNITARKAMVAFGESEKVYHGPGYVTERLGKHMFRVSANSFFQTNTNQAERLYAIAKQMGELSSSDRIFDLYCGTGTIALFMSDAVKSVIGIDVVESAIADARLNAELNSVDNCRFLMGDLKDKLTKEKSWLEEKPDVVVLDPPRSGLHPKVVREVAALSPGRIVYISCNPATQARDARMFAGLGYSVAALQPIDMFPHTPHVENAALLLRR